MGHPCNKVFQTVCNKLKHSVEQFNEFEFHSDCQFGKLSQTFFLTSNTRAEAPLELLQSEIWGSTPILSKEGFRYYIHFTDDHSRLTRVFLLRAKSECKPIFMPFHKLVERQFDKEIKTIQCID